MLSPGRSVDLGDLAGAVRALFGATGFAAVMPELADLGGDARADPAQGIAQRVAAEPSARAWGTGIAVPLAAHPVRVSG